MNAINKKTVKDIKIFKGNIYFLNDFSDKEKVKCTPWKLYTQNKAFLMVTFLIFQMNLLYQSNT